MTQTLLAILLSFLTSCAKPYEFSPGYKDGLCTTPCGAWVDGLTEERCSALARYEGITIQVLSPLLDTDPKQYGVCRRLMGWEIKVMDTKGTGAWTDEWGRRVGGLTYTEFQLIELGTDVWEKSAFAHESIHAHAFPDGDPNHLNWEALGYFKAFDEIKRRYTSDAGQ